MQKQLVNIVNNISLVRQKTMQLADQVKTLEHKDLGIKIYIDKVKKLSMQSLDVLNEMQRQLGFLSNGHKNFELNDKFKKDREKSKKDRETRRSR